MAVSATARSWTHQQDGCAKEHRVIGCRRGLPPDTEQLDAGQGHTEAGLQILDPRRPGIVDDTDFSTVGLIPQLPRLRSGAHFLHTYVERHARDPRQIDQTKTKTV